MNSPAAPPRVRLAPSPTGYFHVGNARTAVFNWLFARQHGGTLIVRVEDTDRSRYVDKALEDMYASLDWLGVPEDESPRKGGDFGPYLQSERAEIHRAHVEELLDSGHAYRCYCTPERLEAVRAARSKSGAKIGYDRRCRNLSAEEVAAAEADGGPSVVRLKVPLSGEIELADVLRGPIVFQASQVEDVVLLKSDGYPTYHLAVVVDDHLMGITHVLRADEWIPSAPIQVLLYEFFGWEQPVWAHLPLVLNPGGKGKLSKRKTVDERGEPVEQMTQVREFRAAGYVPEAMFNYLALQGWSLSGEEDVFTVEEALESFRLEDVRTAPAAWNPEKLAWMNGVYIRGLEPRELARRLLPFMEEAGIAADADSLLEAVPLVQERLTTLGDAPPLLRFLWADQVRPAPEDLVPKKLDAAATVGVLGAAAASLGALGSWSEATVEEALRGMAAERGLKPREAFQPVRVAVTGSRVAPPLFESVTLLGREKATSRLKAAVAMLERA